MAANLFIGPPLLGGIKRLEAIKPPEEFACLRPGEGAKRECDETVVGALRQSERVAGGKEEPASPRPLQPLSKQFRQVLGKYAARQIVLEIIEEKGERVRREKNLGKNFETIRPGMFRLTQNSGES
jgi:hypothetical protein